MQRWKYYKCVFFWHTLNPKEKRKYILGLKEHLPHSGDQEDRYYTNNSALVIISGKPWEIA